MSYSLFKLFYLRMFVFYGYFIKVKLLHLISRSNSLFMFKKDHGIINPCVLTYADFFKR